MVARLKLKGIDGRAPPGVNTSPQGLTAPKSWLPGSVLSTDFRVNSYQLVGSHEIIKHHCVGSGNAIKLREVPKTLSTKRSSKELRGRGNDLGYGKNGRGEVA